MKIYITPASTCQFQSSCDFFLLTPPPHLALLTVNETPFANTKAHINVLAFFVRKGNKRQRKDAWLIKRQKRWWKKEFVPRGHGEGTHFLRCFFVLHESNIGKKKQNDFLDSVTTAINTAAEKASTCKRKVCWAQNIFFLPPPSALLHGFYFCGNQYGGAAVKSNTRVTFSLPV